MTTIGYGALWLSFLFACYVLFATLFRYQQGRWQRSIRRAMLVNAALTTLAAAALFYLLLSHDFSVAYVASHVNRAQPLLFTISAFWAGQEGSLLFWSWAMSLIGALLAGRRNDVDAPRVVALAALAFQQLFVLILLLTQSNPFALLESAPLDGLGMNPLLQNVWMIIHPPVVFIGYALYGAAFGWIMGGLLTAQFERPFWRILERWNLAAWLFLGAGILLGSWWAYLELGWGGYWGWDPVENASLVPWLIGTALLHANIMRRQRRTQQGWVVGLTALTYLLCLFAAFVTRSGLIQSVHAFGRSSIGYLFLGYIALLAILVSVLLYFRQRHLIAAESDTVPVGGRDLAFSLTNLILGGLAFVILVGTLFPTLSELLRGATVALNARFYGQATSPLFVALLATLSVCPVLRWRKGMDADRRHVMSAGLVALTTVALLYALGARQPLSLAVYGLSTLILLTLALRLHHDSERLGGLGEALRRHRRRYGAHLVHLAIALMAIGVTSSSLYAQEDFLQLASGQPKSIFGYEMTLRKGIEEPVRGDLRQTAIIELAKGGRTIAYLAPERRFHERMQQWISEVAIHTTWRGDLYLALAGVEGDRASVNALYNPLVVWIWIGGVLLLIGSAIVLWSIRLPSVERDR